MQTSRGKIGDFVKFENVPQRTRSNIKFDRHSPEPPNYIDRLRSKGWWRTIDYIGNHRRYSGYPEHASTALRQAHYYDEGKWDFLDIGCGDSPDALVVMEQKSYRSAYKVDLFEPLQWQRGVNLSAIEFEKREKEQGVEFIKADVCEGIPLPSRSIGLICANAMIELIPPQDRILFYKECYRLLRPKGILSVTCVSLVNGWIADSDEVYNAEKAGFIILKKGYDFVVQKPTPKGTPNADQ